MLPVLYQLYVLVDTALVIAVLAEAPSLFSCACGGIVSPMGIPVLLSSGSRYYYMYLVAFEY